MLAVVETHFRESVQGAPLRFGGDPEVCEIGATRFISGTCDLWNKRCLWRV